MDQPNFIYLIRIRLTRMPPGTRLNYLSNLIYILNQMLYLNYGSIPISASFLVVTIYVVQFEDIFYFPSSIS